MEGSAFSFWSQEHGSPLVSQVGQCRCVRVLDASRWSLCGRTGRFRLYECFVDGTFSKAKCGGDGIGCTRVGKGVKIMILVDAKGLPVAACSAPGLDLGDPRHTYYVLDEAGKIAKEGSLGN